VESQSLGAPEIETVVVDAGEYGTFEAPYTYVEDAGRLFADVTLTDCLCVPERTVVPLTITAIPETGTEIVTEIGSFTWTSGRARRGRSGRCRRTGRPHRRHPRRRQHRRGHPGRRLRPLRPRAHRCEPRIAARDPQPGHPRRCRCAGSAPPHVAALTCARGSG